MERPMKAMASIFLFLGTFFLFEGETFARTWRVEKDGSGDFTYLQGAAEAAASGDTIRIGVGRFDDFAEYSCELSNTRPKLLVPVQQELTIIGAGVDSTFFSKPESYTEFNIVGIYIQQSCGVEKVFISGITFEFFSSGILAEYGDTLEVTNCRFVGCHKGVNTDFHHLTVTDCDFVGQDGWGSFFVSGFMGGDARTFYMANCTWEGYDGFRPSVALGYGTSESFLVENCSFKGGAGVWETGEWLEHCVQEMRNCQFEDFHRAIIVSQGNVKVFDCVFQNAQFGFWDNARGRSRIDVSGCSFFNMELASFWHEGFKGGSFRNCLLDKGSKGVVVYDPWDKAGEEPLSEYWSQVFGTNSAPDQTPSTSQRLPRFVVPDGPSKADGPYYLDMTNNWWGTTDPDSIQAWIEDGYDVPDLPCYIIWDPFLTENVEAKSISLDDFKASFRR
jgi:hypothetical protein